ncbi:phosphatase PAP2 family protein [Massilibacteroides sp.]|uniref:phosphatase PAP2 family protein n=1 Tax=Massilibacteroides sp. TaxID=2034766 RepID=UPI002602CE18|nr:phosphatase PAP2 family protein [Massilibacteroides sp.]MDD4516048.1 phosphatase PAP2 family protein [Massilibacteroides sp.]
MNRLLLLCLTVLLFSSLSAQTIEVSGSRKTVRTTGDVFAVAIPAACLVSTVALQDWDGLKQGALAGISTVGTAFILKELINKERPDKSDNNSFPSMHAAVSFTGAAFIQKRYGWKWGIPAYAAASFVGWSRVYGKKHDWWDVAAGAALGVASAYVFTKPFAEKYNLSIAPAAGKEHIGFYASLRF